MLIGNPKDFEAQFRQLGLSLTDVESLLVLETLGTHKIKRTQTKYEKKPDNKAYTKVFNPLFDGNSTSVCTISHYLDYDLLIGCFDSKYTLDKVVRHRFDNTTYVAKLIFYTKDRRYKFIVNYELVTEGDTNAR